MRPLFLPTLMLLIISTSAFAEGLKVIAEDWPPFSFKQNESLSGFSIEILEHLFSDTGVELEGSAEIWPWTRALLEIQKAPNILITAMNRNESREKLFKWVGPISPREIWLYKLTSREDIILESIDDAKNYQVGVGRGSSSADYLIKHGFIEGENLQLTTIEIQNIKKLLLGRVDLVPFNIAEMAWHLKQLRPPQSLQVVTPVLLMSEGTQYYFALSKQVPDAIVFKLQKAFDEMKQDGRYMQIWQKYMN